VEKSGRAGHHKSKILRSLAQKGEPAAAGCLEKLLNGA